MKTLALALLSLGLMSSFARANNATCMDNHEDQAAQLVAKEISQRISAALAKKNIQLAAEKNSIELSAAQVNFQNDGLYGYFRLSSDRLTTSKGTELVVEYKQTSFREAEDATTLYLKPVLKSAGFDNEGNAIKASCTLVADEVRVNDKAEFIYVSNVSSGKFLVRVELPSKIRLY